MARHEQECFVPALQKLTSWVVSYAFAYPFLLPLDVSSAALNIPKHYNNVYIHNERMDKKSFTGAVFVLIITAAYYVVQIFCQEFPEYQE